MFLVVFADPRTRACTAAPSCSSEELAELRFLLRCCQWSLVITILLFLFFLIIRRLECCFYSSGCLARVTDLLAYPVIVFLYCAYFNILFRRQLWEDGFPSLWGGAG